MSIIRERVSRAAISAVGSCAPSSIGPQWAGGRAVEFFDVAIRVGATEYQAAEVALDYLGSSLVKQYTGMESGPRERMMIRAGEYMQGAAQGFAKEGREAAFDRLCAVAELKA